LCHSGALIVPDLHRQDATGRQQPRGRRNQCTVGVKPVAAAVQRANGIVIADLRGEIKDIGGADIGRVRYDQIEPT
jgi:hypothetical protein